MEGNTKMGSFTPDNQVKILKIMPLPESISILCKFQQKNLRNDPDVFCRFRSEMQGASGQADLLIVPPGALGMLLVVLPDLHHDPFLSLIIHFLYEIIVEIECSLLQAHGSYAIEKHFFCLLDIPAVNMV